MTAPATPPYTPSHPAVIAVVDHYVRTGFDPSYAEYDEVAEVTLTGLAEAGWRLIGPPRTPSERSDG